MKSITYLSVAALFFLCISCNNNPQEKYDQNKSELPESLKDDMSSYGRGDILNMLYADVVKKDTDLQKMESQLKQFYTGLPDSLEKFNNYNTKSTRYYEMAHLVLKNMTDTVLRAGLDSLVAESKVRYLLKIKKYSNLMTYIDSNKVKIEDYRIILKVLSTMPVIENYQNKNMPDIKSIVSIATDAKTIKAKTVQLTKKYEEN